MHEGIPKIGLIAQLVVIQTHQAAPHEHGDEGTDEGIGQHDPDEEARLGPENAGERHHVHEGPQEDEQKAQGDAGKIADILADALVWVIDLGRDFNVVIGAPLKVRAQKMVGQPCPPAQPQIGLYIPMQGDNRNTQQKAGKVHAHKQVSPGLVLAHQGIGKKVADIAEANVNPSDRNRQEEHDREQHPRLPARSYLATKR